MKNSKAGRKRKLTLSEVITLALIQHFYGIKTVKHLYTFIVFNKELSSAFHELPAYEQLNRAINQASFYIYLAMKVITQINVDKDKDYYIIDSTPLPICNFTYADKVKIDEKKASSSKNMHGWYHGFKLHIIINKFKDIVSFKFTTASVSDSIAIDENFIKSIKNWLIGDKGYISKKLKKWLHDDFYIYLLTYFKKNMKKRELSKHEKKLLRKRKNIETVFSVLKEHFSLINQFTRLLIGFFRHALCAMLAYSLKKFCNNTNLLNFAF